MSGTTMWMNFIPLLAWSLLFMPFMAACHRVAWVPPDRPLTRDEQEAQDDDMVESSNFAATVYIVGCVIYLAIGIVLCETAVH
jgi:hypothetical protein